MTGEVHEFFLTMMAMGLAASIASGTAHGLQQAIATYAAVVAAALGLAGVAPAASGAVAAEARQAAPGAVVGGQAARSLAGAQLQFKLKTIQVASVALGTLITAAHVMERLTLRATAAVKEAAAASDAGSATPVLAFATAASSVSAPKANPVEQQQASSPDSRQADVPAAAAGDQQAEQRLGDAVVAVTEHQEVAVEHQEPAAGVAADSVAAAAEEQKETPAAERAAEIAAASVEVDEEAAQPVPTLAAGRQLLAGSWQPSVPLTPGRQMGAGSCGLAERLAIAAPSSAVVVEAAAAVELAAAAVQLAHAAVEVAEAVAASHDEDEAAAGEADMELVPSTHAPSAAAHLTACDGAEAEEAAPVGERKAGEQEEGPRADAVPAEAQEQQINQMEPPNGDAVRPGMSIEEATTDVKRWMAAWHSGSAGEQEAPAGAEAAPAATSAAAEDSDSKEAPPASDSKEAPPASGAEEEEASPIAAAAPITRITEPSLPGIAAAVLAAITADAPVASTPVAAGDASNGAAAAAQEAEGQAAEVVEAEQEPVLALALAAPVAPVPVGPSTQEREAAYKARIAAVLAESKLAGGMHAPGHVAAGAAGGALAASQSQQLQPQALRNKHLAMRSKGMDCLQGAPSFQRIAPHPASGAAAAPSPEWVPASYQPHQRQAAQEELMARSNRILQNLAALEAAERRQQQEAAPSRFARVMAIAHFAWQALLGLCLTLLAGLAAVCRAAQRGAGRLADRLTGISDGDEDSSSGAPTFPPPGMLPGGGATPGVSGFQR
ncbi:hypothetical protein CHLNCDRAFT_138162 [Chlorella variabilis]|uniref:Uncharacterized protein n=1 Tax=Chlorella variabilis TaxID=554065 RepID=E1Z3P6_CHLVA|nr:hypothetical protein CHLNCDRAFT_138162 [Chlorella variabilis]EFN59516.1 hypothetical protein CHLNCDRAFT_138162 [Chlorella variabilis]|eukprot:XP_005851618.1 hypothetical protein CHLNCDRAFT_138162 [Chlorella variabilis]